MAPDIPGIPDIPLVFTSPLRDQSDGRPKLLSDFYRDVAGYEFIDTVRARSMFDRLMAEGLEHYTAPADVWHNTSMVAAHAEHRQAELALIQAGLAAWPDNVDLLCDEFQLRYSTHFDLERAAAIWTKLAGMDRRKTGPYWRFWAYGAIYHATTLFDPVTALQLLNDGLHSVTRDSLCDLLRIYRRVLIDSIPKQSLAADEDIVDYQKYALEQLEEKYRLGIRLGVENAYVLATELATLYQERAGEELDTGKTSEPGEDYLRKALDCLELAEKLYTGNRNHPVDHIYGVRVRILMAQHRYGDALKLLYSLPADDPSMRVMKALAEQMTGVRTEDAKEITLEAAINRAVPALFENDSALLIRVAESNSAIKDALIRVAQKLLQS